MQAVYDKFVHVYLQDVDHSGTPVFGELCSRTNFEDSWEKNQWAANLGPLLLVTKITLPLEHTVQELIVLKLGALQEALTEARAKAEREQKAIKDSITALSMIGYDGGSVTVLEDVSDDNTHF